MEINETELGETIAKAVDEKVTAAVKGAVDASIKEALSAKAEAEQKAAQELDSKYKTFGEYLWSIARLRKEAVPDNRLTYVTSKGEIVKPGVNIHGKATLVEGTDSAGGFLVPAQYQAQLIQDGLETAVVRANGAFVVPMSSDTLAYPRIAESTRASTVYGGVVGYWQAEGGTYQESEPAFGEIRLTAHKLMGYTKVSEELLADSAISLDPFIRRTFAEAWAHFEDIAFLRGTGSGQPLGILNAPALVSVTRQDTDDLFFGDILNIWARVKVGSRARGVWVCNHDCFPKLLSMHAANTATNTYGAQLVFINSINGVPQMQIFGRPVILTEKMSTMGTVGDVGFFDFGNYIIGDRQGLTIDMSGQVYWTTGHVAYKFTERVDGQPMVASALTPYQGSNSLSPFVSLAETS